SAAAGMPGSQARRASAETAQAVGSTVNGAAGENPARSRNPGPRTVQRSIFRRRPVLTNEPGMLRIRTAQPLRGGAGAFGSSGRVWTTMQWRRLVVEPPKQETSTARPKFSNQHPLAV